MTSKQAHALKTKLAALENKITQAKRENMARGFAPNHKTSKLADLQNKAQSLRLILAAQ